MNLICTMHKHLNVFFFLHNQESFTIFTKKFGVANSKAQYFILKERMRVSKYFKTAFYTVTKQ